jgi:chromosome segregation ATPase
VIISLILRMSKEPTADGDLLVRLQQLEEEISQKDKQSRDLEFKLEQAQGHVEKLEKTISTLEAELGQLNSTHQENVKQLDQLENQLTDKTNTINRLEERVTELEPLSEAVEQEKLRRIKVTFRKNCAPSIFVLPFSFKITIAHFRKKPSGVSMKNY